MIKEIEAKSALYYHEKTFASNWDLNIYRGCTHRCQYCFAQYSHKYLESENFFNDIYVKTNIAEIFDRELTKKRKWNYDFINICGITDCYQHAEKIYKIMPKIIKVAKKHRNPIILSTKSTLILRDLNIIEELSKHVSVKIISSVSVLDEEKRKLIEPGAPPSIERLNMLKKFKEIGCETHVLFIPIIPYISDNKENLNDVFQITKEYNLDNITVYPLHLRGNTKYGFYKFLNDNFSELIGKYNLLYQNGNVKKEYYQKLNIYVQKLRKKYNLYNRKIPLKKREQLGQMKLF